MKKFHVIDKKKTGFVPAAEILNILKPGKDAQIIDEAIMKEADELVKYLLTVNGGKVDKVTWKTAFGTIFDKVN